MTVQIREQVPLKPYNTFGVAAIARRFVEIRSEIELVELFRQPDVIAAQPLLVLGGGSNVLFTRDYDGLVVRMNIPGIRHEISGRDVVVTAGAGVVWNDLVWYCVDRGFGGIENLALIPGTVGAAPVQNIGAYGVELNDVFLYCRVYDTHRGEITTLNRADCRFAYRDSIFKHEAKGRYIITEVALRLMLDPVLNTSYGAISHELDRRNITQPTIRDIATVVSAIRTEKLPDPSTIGNSGSFFKNPIIPVDQFKKLQQLMPDTNVVWYPVDDNHVKLAAGWLIEQCGWKGRRIGDAGTWKNQALVLVNHNNATGSEIYALSEQIIQDVENRFGVTLEREVNVF